MRVGISWGATPCQIPWRPPAWSRYSSMQYPSPHGSTQMIARRRPLLCSHVSTADAAVMPSMWSGVAILGTLMVALMGCVVAGMRARGPS